MKDLMAAYEEARFGTPELEKSAAVTPDDLMRAASTARTADEAHDVMGWLERLVGKARRQLSSSTTTPEAAASWYSVVQAAPEASQMMAARFNELSQRAAAIATARTALQGAPSIATSARAAAPQAAALQSLTAPLGAQTLLPGFKLEDLLPAVAAAPASAARAVGQPFRIPARRKALRGLLRNAKVVRALKTFAPIGLGIGAPLAGYGALKGLDALLTAKKAADDSRSLTSRIADYFAMSKLTPESRRLRDTIERLIRDEKRLRAQALDEIQASRSRLQAPVSTGPLGLASDIVRSAIPGLAPTAALEDDGIEKGAIDLELDEGPSGGGTLAHLLAGGVGAGIGAGVQRGALGGLRRADILAEGLPANLSSVISDAVQGVGSEQTQAATKKLLQGMRGTQLAQLAGAERPGILSGLSNLLTHRTVRDPQGRLLRRLRATVGESPATSKRLASRVIEQLGNALKGAQRSGVTAPGWKLGAGIGAAALTLPFVIRNLIRARSIRAEGGPAASAAATRAAQLLAQANKLQEQRQQLLSQLS